MHYKCHESAKLVICTLIVFQKFDIEIMFLFILKFSLYQYYYVLFEEEIQYTVYCRTHVGRSVRR